MTFNNRIALRNGLAQTESVKLQTSSSSSRVPIRRGAELGNEDAFYVGTNTFGVKSQEVYEIGVREILTISLSKPAWFLTHTSLYSRLLNMQNRRHSRSLQCNFGLDQPIIPKDNLHYTYLFY